MGAYFSNQQYRSQQEVEERRAQDTALQSYLEQMSKLLTDADLFTSQPGDEVRTIARSRTLTVIESLNAQRKRTVVEFLFQAGLLYKGDPAETSAAFEAPTNHQGRMRIIATLDSSSSAIVELDEANLRGADLSGAYLFGTDFGSADFSYANLSGATLRSAELKDATLYGADLGGADLQDANVDQNQLDTSATLIGATMPDGSKHN